MVESPESGLSNRLALGSVRLRFYSALLGEPHYSSHGTLFRGAGQEARHRRSPAEGSLEEQAIVSH